MIPGRYFDAPDMEWYKQRLTRIVFVVMVVFSALFLRLFYLQAIGGSEYRRLSENNCIRLQTIQPARGLIFDRNGELLVDNRPSFDLYITPKDATPLEETLLRLSHFSGIELADLKSRIAEAKGRPFYKPVLLMRDMGRDLFAAVEVHRYELPGVFVSIEPLRHYLNERFAPHLIGYLGEINGQELASGEYVGRRQGDVIGKFGIERTLENYLKGKPGGRQVEVNAAGQVIRVLRTVNAVSGDKIYLTLDKRLQELAQTLFEGKVGSAVAMDPSNGEVLAMVSSPGFDQNEFVGGLSHKAWNKLMSNPDRPMENKAIQGEYPPASTYKIITALGGLEENVIDAHTAIFCNGKYRFGDRVFRDWKKGGHGSVDVEKAIAQSCDVFFYQVGQKLGVDRLARYARAAGLGEVSGIDLGNEKPGLVPTSAWKKQKTGVPWRGGETLSVAIGQGYNLATPLQVLCVTCAVGNGGTRYRPQIFKKIETPYGDLVRENFPEPVGKLPVSAENQAIVRKGLFKVVNEPGGTAFQSRIAGIPMSGKTGTAQVVGRGESPKTKGNKTSWNFLDHAWFTAYAPSDNPKIAVTIMVEHGEHGSSAAAPIAAKMIYAYLSQDYKIEAEPVLLEE